jgi:hypothetical protein
MPTETLTLTDFLLARIAEDEADASRRRSIPASVDCSCGEVGELENLEASSAGDTRITVGHKPTDALLANTAPTGVEQTSVDYGGNQYGGSWPAWVTHVITDPVECKRIRETFPLTSSAVRLLAECEAKRQIVESLSREGQTLVGLGEAVEQRMRGAYVRGSYDALDDVLHVLVLPYVDHPDYRDEWRP